MSIWFILGLVMIYSPSDYIGLSLHWLLNIDSPFPALATRHRKVSQSGRVVPFKVFLWTWILPMTLPLLWIRHWTVRGRVKKCHVTWETLPSIITCGQYNLHSAIIDKETLVSHSQLFQYWSHYSSFQSKAQLYCPTKSVNIAIDCYQHCWRHW